MSARSIDYYIGIDGCPGGWMVVARRQELWFAAVYPTILSIYEQYGSNSRYLIDMPMGLADKKVSRTIETELRKKLSPVRHQSVFTPPVRDAVYTPGYKEALSINRSLTGKGISIQAWNISKKIRELDQFLIKNHEARVLFYESHPELCFHQLNQGPVYDTKHTAAGRQMRKLILFKNAPDIAQIIDSVPEGAAETDLLDASVLALTAGSRLSFIINSIDMDSKGIPIRLAY